MQGVADWLKAAECSGGFDHANVDATADQLLDYLASDRAVGQWMYCAELRDWELLYNLRNERYVIGRLARSLGGRGLAETRRAALGMQLRLTQEGITLASERERKAAGAAAEIDWSGVAW